MDGEQGRLGEVTLLDVRGRVGKAPKDTTGYVRTVYEGLRADYQVRHARPWACEYQHLRVSAAQHSRLPFLRPLLRPNLT